MEGFHEAHVDVAILLHLQQEGELGSALLTERQEKGAVSLQTNRWRYSVKQQIMRLPWFTLRYFIACSATSSSFLFHSTALMMHRHNCTPFRNDNIKNNCKGEHVTKTAFIRQQLQ